MAAKKTQSPLACLVRGGGGRPTKASDTEWRHLALEINILKLCRIGTQCLCEKVVRFFLNKIWQIPHLTAFGSGSRRETKKRGPHNLLTLFLSARVRSTNPFLLLLFLRGRTDRGLLTSLSSFSHKNRHPFLSTLGLTRDEREGGEETDLLYSRWLALKIMAGRQTVIWRKIYIQKRTHAPNFEICNMYIIKDIFLQKLVNVLLHPRCAMVRLEEEDGGCRRCARGEIHASGDRPRFFQEEKRVYTTPSSPSFPSFLLPISPFLLSFGRCHVIFAS